MKLYFDNNILFIKEQRYELVYNPHTHYILRLSNDACNLLKQIISLGSGTKFELKDFIVDSEDIKILKQLINDMLRFKFFFKTKKEFEEHSFFHKIKKMEEKFNILTVYIHLTQKCNLQCSYCYNKQNLNQWEELSKLEWFKIIDALKNMGVREFIFTGGEPLIRDDLFDILKYTKQEDNSIELLTNGTLLKDENVKVLKFVDQVIISLDTIDKVSNDKHRKNSKNYNILDNLHNIPKEYSNKIVIRSVITKENQMYIEETKNYVENILGFQFTSIIFIPNNLNEVDLVPEIIIDDVDEECKMKFSNKIMNCGACSKEIAINSNGDIYPCQNLIKKEFLLTNILHENWLEELKNSYITKQFMQLDVRNIEKCKDCSLKFVCGGGCRAIAYNVYGDLNAHLEFFCDFLSKNAISRLKNIKFKSS